MKSPSRTFVIRHATADRSKAIYAFHKKYLSKYLWPRSIEEFERLVEDERLYEAVEIVESGESLVGICYIMEGEEPDQASKVARLEFGGIFVIPEVRHLGLASKLGICAISNQYAMDPPKGRIVAHVHEFNESPRRVLTRELGFIQDGKEIPPKEIAPKSMERNGDGEVVGHLFVFQKKKLSSFADWLEGFADKIEGKNGVISNLSIDLFIMKVRKDIVALLRETADA